MLFLALRFGYYLVKLKSSLRYGAGRAVPKEIVTREPPGGAAPRRALRRRLAFDAAERYGEKRDLGYLGTVLFYGGLMVLLFFGSYDYMREYSIMVRTGVGLPMPMDGKGLVGEFEAGLIARPRELPQLQVKKQILPNKQWPKGATEIALVDKEGKELSKSTVAPGKPYIFDGLEYHMIQFVFDALLVVREGKYIIFDEFVKFVPMAKPKDGYTYYAPSLTTQSKLRGGAWLNPEKKTVRLIGKLGDKNVVDTELALWGKNVTVQGEYKSTLEGLGHWSEIRVTRERHRGLMVRRRASSPCWAACSASWSGRGASGWKRSPAAAGSGPATCRRRAWQVPRRRPRR